MRSPLLLIFFVSLSITAAFAKVPIGYWQSVEEIPAGWEITVITTFTFPCIFESATDIELICRQLYRHANASKSHEIHVRRGAIREIRVEKRDGANRVAAASIGGVVGAGFGAIAVAAARGPAAYLFGTMGALMGARKGNDTHVLRGKVIYRSP